MKLVLKAYGVPKKDGSGLGIRVNKLRNPACRDKMRDDNAISFNL